MFWKLRNANRMMRRRNAGGAMIENLEHRMLFASISTGTDSIGKVITFTGGDGANTVTITDDGGGNVSQTSLNLNLKGGNGSDAINVSYQGDMDGTLAISALLDQFIDLGHDTADIVVILDSGSGSVSSGGHKLTLRVEGGLQDDTITALVGDHSGGNVSVSASVDAGSNFPPVDEDEVTRTANVSVTNAEIIHTVSAPAFV